MIITAPQKIVINKITGTANIDTFKKLIFELRDWFLLLDILVI